MGLVKREDKHEENGEEFSEILSYEMNPQKGNLHFYSKDESGKHFKNHKNLKKWLSKRKQQLKFAMNGGMYKKDLSPQGLYIENGKQEQEIDKKIEGFGNFYLQPNGIFYLTNDNEPHIVMTKEYQNNDNVKYATQSGPMLLMEGKMHSKFNENSKNIHIRNGVGILPNGNLLFAMSKEKVNFYKFASYFKSKKCENALYLDGCVSKTYLPSKNWKGKDGKYGIIIAEIE